MLFNQTLTYISLFSGAGVGCYGLLEEGFECVATNEILEKRLNIQRINRKCKFDESYISGDIKKPETKEKILKQIEFYSKKFGNDRVDLVVATPPCQGMSVANHIKIAFLTILKQQFKSTWGCLNWNKISPTIDTRFDTPSNGTNSHPELHRSITPREAARIQSFSDNYIFYGNKTSVCKQIGNAVPPLLALALGKAILKNLRK